MKWQINEPKFTVEQNEVFEVRVPEHVYAKMMGYIDAVDGEISGMGEVQKVGNTYTVTDIWLLKQENTGTSTRIDAVSLADLRAEVYSQGKAQDGFQLWWHSHANMDTFWSGTDKATMDMFMTDIPWMLFIVANKKRSFRARVQFKEPFNVAFEDIPVFVETALAYDKEEIEREVRAKVRDKWESSQGSGRTDWARRPGSYMDDGFFRGDGYVTPGERGERYWQSLSKKERKTMRRYSEEEEPMCFFTDCSVCSKRNYVFYVKKFKHCVCLSCARGVVEAAYKGIKISHETEKVNPEDLKGKEEKAGRPPEVDPTPPGQVEQGGES